MHNYMYVVYAMPQHVARHSKTRYLLPRRLWYCAWLSYLLDSSEYKSLTQNARYMFWFNI